MEFVTRLSGTLIALGLLPTMLGCNGNAHEVPTTLVDGSLARPPPVVLEGVDGPTLRTKVRRTTTGAATEGSRAASCLSALAHRQAGSVVERIGASGASVTLLAARRRIAHACDATANTWCGRAFGRFEAGRLRDPRLSLTCRDSAGEPVGFAWLQPDPAATFVVVHSPGYAEVYRTARGVPVRVTTLEADLATSRATFRISEHGSDGRRLRAYELDAQVAG
jgi:hypothetical protein